MSVPQIAVRRTRISTSCAPGTGSGACVGQRPSPALSLASANICRASLGEGPDPALATTALTPVFQAGAQTAPAAPFGLPRAIDRADNQTCDDNHDLVPLSGQALAVRPLLSALASARNQTRDLVQTGADLRI